LKFLLAERVSGYDGVWKEDQLGFIIPPDKVEDYIRVPNTFGDLDFIT
jgi:hypothetical protein